MESIQVKVERWGRGGAGIAVLNDQFIRIPYAIPGEILEINIRDRGRFFTNAEIKKIISGSSDRSTDICPLAGFCPGCQIRQLAYPVQLSWLKNRVEYVLRREFGDNIPVVMPCIPYLEPMGYRCRGNFHILDSNGKIVIGMPSGATKNVNLTRCPNHFPELNRLLLSVERSFNGLDEKGRRQAVMSIRGLSVTLSDNGYHRIVFETGQPDKRDQIHELVGNLMLDQSLSILVTENEMAGSRLRQGAVHVLQGERWIELISGGRKYHADYPAWIPVSGHSASLLSATLLDFLDETRDRSILEIGCGIGLQTLMLAHAGYRIVGMDRDRFAIGSAMKNKTFADMNTVEFIHGQARKGLKKLAAVRQKFGTIIFHGMRRGYGREVMDFAMILDVNRIILISPTAGALGNDLKSIVSMGWNCHRIALIDQIPHTVGVLAVAECERN